MGKRSLIIFTGVLIGVLVLGAGALYAYDHGHRDKIAKGVAVAGIDVGGLSAAQARARLDREYLPRFKIRRNSEFGSLKCCCGKVNAEPPIPEKCGAGALARADRCRPAAPMASF